MKAVISLLRQGNKTEGYITQAQQEGHDFVIHCSPEEGMDDQNLFQQLVKRYFHQHYNKSLGGVLCILMLDKVTRIPSIFVIDEEGIVQIQEVTPALFGRYRPNPRSEMQGWSSTL